MWQFARAFSAHPRLSLSVMWWVLSSLILMTRLERNPLNTLPTPFNRSLSIRLFWRGKGVWEEEVKSVSFPSSPLTLSPSERADTRVTWSTTKATATILLSKKRPWSLEKPPDHCFWRRNNFSLISDFFTFFREYCIPILMTLWSIRDGHARIILLKYFGLYAFSFKRDVLENFILPQVCFIELIALLCFCCLCCLC